MLENISFNFFKMTNKKWPQKDVQSLGLLSLKLTCLFFWSIYVLCEIIMLDLGG